MDLGQKSWTVLGAAALIRLIVFAFFPRVVEFLSVQVEIGTPISSFKRLQEGLFLHSRGVSPYDGGVFHQAPLLLSVFEFLPASIVFTGIDLVNAISLGSIAGQLHVPSPRFEKLSPTVIMTGYLFNPFTILSCLGRSTTTFTNASIIQAVLHAAAGKPFESMLALATGTYLSLYPILILPPLVIFYRQSSGKATISVKSPLTLVAYYFGSLATLLTSTLVYTGDIWEFLSSCYGAQITVTDLTPNIGLWWYFFIEMFDAFRDFFIGVFWLHLISYVGGLTIRLQDQPVFVIICLLGLITIFKPYPSISDVSLYLGFLALYKHILPLTRYLFVAASVLLYSTLLGPAFYHLWIYAGSGNANFFYAITLVWSLGLTILVGDTLYAVLRDEWETERPEMKGKEAQRI